MQSIGEELRAAREAKGLSLTEIAEKTRISHTFLKALEDDDYTVIPGNVFVSGFLRTYAKELGLNVKEIMARHRELNPPPKETPEPDDKEVQHHPKPSLISISRSRRPAERPARRKIPLYLIIMAGLVIGAALTGATLLFFPKRPVNTRASMPPPPAARKSPAPVMKAATSFKNSASATRPAQKPFQAAGPLTLRLFAAEDSYYSYRADNIHVMSGILKKGETRVIKANSQIDLTLGNAGGVTAELNGKKMGPFGKEAEVVRGIVFVSMEQGARP